MSLRLTLFFNASHTGWTETWYQNGAASVANDPAAVWDDIFKKAVKFRGKGTVLYGVRQSIFGTGLNTSYFTKFGNKYVRPITDPSDQDPDVVLTDALYYVYSPSRTKKRPVYLRGLVDSDVKVDANYVDQPTPTFTSNVAAYLKALAGASFGMQLINQAPVDAGPVVNVTSVEADATNSGYTRIHLSVGMNLAQGDRLIFRGVVLNDLPGFPKITTNKSAAGAALTVFSIPYRYRASVPIYNPLKMTVQLYKVTVVGAQDNNWQFWEFSEHRAGRPFGSPRGRKRSAVKAQ